MHVYDLREPYPIPFLGWDNAVHHASLPRQ